ncbi:transposase [sulfur-oxidizing endosymbiont of Gigantopelta aegis]|uniref:transposase n=1 Tax=sulfur-oxidizing endosymbiont of Gigantopelta aegis TaxID=2794934 RepID=UPI0018DC6B64|nr:transposase [sulfur-oxidizing endosymbiont of Gigantopelta aegis]
MSSTDKILPEEIPTLKNRVLELQSKVDWYEEQFRLLQHKRFGTSSEKEVHPDFFNEAETFAEEAPEVRETITYERKKPGRKPLPKDLPRKVVRHELSEAEQVCDCGHHLHVMCQHFSGQFSKYFLAVSSDFCHFVFPIILVSHVNFKQMKRKGFALWNDRAVPFTQGIFTTVMILLQYLHGTG